MENSRKIKKTISTFSFMIVATMLGKILGLIRQLFIAAYYGDGIQAQSFTIASKLPMYFFEFALGAAVSSAFIPIFNEYLEKKGKKEAFKFTNNFMNIAIVISVVITIVGMLLTPILIKIMAAGFSQEAFELTVSLTRIMFPMMIFAIVAYIFVGMLQSFDEFNVPAAISVISNLALLIYLIGFEEYGGVYGLAIAMVIGWSLQMLVQVPFVKKKGYKYQRVFDIHDEGIKKTLIFIGPLLVSTWVQPMNDIVNNRLASTINGGAGVPILSYAYQLYFIIAGVFALAISSLIFPTLSRASAGKDMKSFQEIIKNALLGLVYILVPLSVGMIVLRVPLIQLLYERGAFTHEQTLLTAIPLLFYAIGITGFGVKEVLNRGFYALGDVKTPMKISIVGILLNMVGSVILIDVMGIGGLALSSSISITSISILLLFKLNKNDKIKVWDRHIVKEMMKVSVASLGMGFLIHWCLGQSFFIKMTEEIWMYFLAIAGLVIIGVLTYFVLTLALGVDYSKKAVSIISKKLDL